MTTATPARLLPAVASYLDARAAERDRIDPDRRLVLRRIATFVRDRLDREGSARLIFICTHNSRRSHFAQVWAEVAARSLGLSGIHTFSGGTEATALHPNARAAFARAGLVFETPAANGNPHHRIHYAVDRPPLIVFSKVYDAVSNPRADFGAVMTCSDADEGCPVVHGAAWRVATPYEDPKRADGSESVDAVYDASCAEIAREMLETMAAVLESRKTD